MPIRRIIKFLRSQYESLQKRFGSNSKKSSPVASPTDAVEGGGDGVVPVESVPEETPVTTDQQAPTSSK
ncbi:hypothetical protein CANARDRAFT_30713 [[Candida] arabinofermentans NRRL YB-2248]|uniref:Uncharacterized protein n=1 Tax=[Candida] arabinofermentans NRRL YB-2248 TaxID=983967 RepID=A0A1E4SSW8_9ASCO|nr:hypothetical protein CANARDRAFT_30713 [[Candida] arabinofermentans NRRL YB-2248]